MHKVSNNELYVCKNNPYVTISGSQCGHKNSSVLQYLYKITNIAISQSLLWFYNKIFTAQKKEEHIQKSLDLNIFMHQEESTAPG